jgi:hypothetical protein
LDSDLSEINEVAVHNLNALEKWLAKGKCHMAKVFALHKLNNNDISRQHGPYKKKGTVQSKRTQQHNKKMEWDWTAKMKS